MLINGTGRLYERVRCRECGAWGLEDPAIDPAPGLCPACYEKKLDAAFEDILRDLGGTDIEDTLHALDGTEREDPPLDQIKRRAGDPTLPGFDLGTGPGDRGAPEGEGA